MNLKLGLIIFIIYQSYPVLSQQQGANPNQPFVPGGWFRPLYSAAADAWRDYLIRAQQATNQFYQQWANLTGISNPGGGLAGFGSLGGLYSGGNQQQGSTSQTPRPLQGIFNPSNVPTGFDMSELLPGNQKPGRQGPNHQIPLQDSSQPETTPRQPQQVQQIQPQAAPPIQQPSSIQQVPPVQQPFSIQQTPPIQQPTQTQPKPTPQVQQQPPQQTQQQPNTQTQGRPLQTLGQATSTVGLFGGASPMGWIG